MKKSDAIKNLDRLIFRMVKVRSNAMLTFGAENWDQMTESSRQVLSMTMPAFFNVLGVFEMALKTQEKGEKINPIDIYNLVIMIKLDPQAEFMLNKMLPSENDIKLEGLDFDGVPSWITGWEDICPVCNKNLIDKDRDGTCVDCSH